MKRRQFIGAGLTLSIGTGAALIASRYAHGATRFKYSASLDDSAANHLLNRAAFGCGGKNTIANLQAIGLEQWLEQQLAPKQIMQPELLRNELESLKTVSQSQAQLLGVYKLPRDEQPTAFRLTASEARRARLWQAIYSEAQLSEVMTAFWFNHFNVFEAKDRARVVTGHFDSHAIRPHVFGRFRDLLGATAKHPAMLIYLDNFRSSAGRINENYAREVMELHTVGADGGYDQSDVTTLARMFTGWTIPRADAVDLAGDGDVFRFDSRRHDDGAAQWFGQTITVKGQSQAEFALDFLAAHPATAKRIAFKLAQYFIADEPPADCVARLATVYLQSNGLIADVLRALFTDTAFWSLDVRGKKFKTPYEYAVSAMRASAIQVQSLQPLLASMQQQGQPLFGCQTPDGYKNTEAALLSPEVLNHRIQFATTFGAGKLLALTKTGPLDAVSLQQTLQSVIGVKNQTLIANAAPELRAGLMLSTPEFMRR